MPIRDSTYFSLVPMTVVYQKNHASKHPMSTKHPPDVILHGSFTRPSTVLAVIEGLGTRLHIRLGRGSKPHSQAMWYVAWEQGQEVSSTPQ